MKKFIIVIFSCIIGCSPKIVDLDSLCKDIDNSYECAQIIEKYQLKEYDDLVKRNNKKLVLKTDKNSEITLEDIDKESDGVWYTFRDYIKEINAYIIEIQYYEGGAYYLINKNSGDKIKIPGLVKVSPDKLQILSYNMDIEAGYSANGFVIYKIVKNSYIKEFETEFDEWGPSNAKWINDNQIQFEKSAWKEDKVSVVGKVVYENKGSWRMKN